MQPKDTAPRGLWTGLLLAIAVVGLGAGPIQAADGPTFDQVLAAPNDVNLNFDYARAEAHSGNLLNAAAAMERVLDVKPDWNEARLFYAAVLVQLDDVQDARGQLNLISDADLTPAQRQQADQYRRQVGPWGWRP